MSIALPLLDAALFTVVGGALPFWMKFRLSTDGVIYVVGLTLLAAAIVGVVPALKATGAACTSGCRRCRRAAARGCRWADCGRC